MSISEGKIKPIRDRVLIELTGDDEVINGIHVTNATGEYSKATILELPQGFNEKLAGVKIRDTVLVLKSDIERAAIGQNKYLIPFGAIVASCLADADTPEEDSSSLVEFPTWDGFTDGGTLLNSFKDWQNVKEFQFSIKFAEPFCEMLPIANLMYESCRQEIGPHVNNVIDAFHLTVEPAEEKRPLQDHSQILVECKDDYWDGALLLSGKDRTFAFIKKGTGLEAILETVPHWMKAYSRTLFDPQFRNLIGTDYKRVALASMRISQVIRLEDLTGRNEFIRNSNSMGHFLRFGLTKEDRISPTIEQFGIGDPFEDSIGRVNVSMSYDRRIGERETPFRIWFTAEAPTNDKSKLIHVTWDIQDVAPQDLVSERYGECLTKFFRDVVLRGVYKTWFENIKCSTDR